MRIGAKKTGSFLVKHFKTILMVLFGLVLLYWVIFVLTPVITMPDKEKSKIDSLNNMIKDIYKDQNKLDSSIVNFNSQISSVDSHISEIKNKKTIIKEIYHEQINRVDNYTDYELDSFFTVRYGHFEKY
jgi:vacuolar-type H+-ATPase subunit I/STV1